MVKQKAGKASSLKTVLQARAASGTHEAQQFKGNEAQSFSYLPALGSSLVHERHPVHGKMNPRGYEMRLQGPSRVIASQTLRADTQCDRDRPRQREIARWNLVGSKG